MLMNLPNLLSTARILLVPLMILLAAQPGNPAWYAAMVVFMAACITDYLDGQIARNRKLITDLGRFLDPLADKLLVLSALILLTVHGLNPLFLTVTVLARELAVDGLRMVAASQGKVIAAGYLGKVKTFSQMLYIILCFATAGSGLPVWLSTVCVLWILVITLWSGIDYFLRNRSVLTAGK